MNLQDALEQIETIHGHIARTQTFRGYRSWTTAFSGIVAIATALLQPLLLPDPAHAPRRFVALWVTAAVISLIAVAAEMILRVRRARSRVQGSLTLQAAEQFVPALIAGGMLTAILTITAPDLIWLLPGLWQVLFALGVFASCRILPRSTFLVAGLYLIAGMATLLAARGPYALNPMAMGIPFGVGQLITAAVLYWKLERHHEGT